MHIADINRPTEWRHVVYIPISRVVHPVYLVSGAYTDITGILLPSPSYRALYNIVY